MKKVILVLVFLSSVGFADVDSKVDVDLLIAKDRILKLKKIKFNFNKHHLLYPLKEDKKMMRYLNEIIEIETRKLKTIIDKSKH